MRTRGKWNPYELQHRLMLFHLEMDLSKLGCYSCLISRCIHVHCTTRKNSNSPSLVVLLGWLCFIHPVNLKLSFFIVWLPRFIQRWHPSIHHPWNWTLNVNEEHVQPYHQDGLRKVSTHVADHQVCLSLLSEWEAHVHRVHHQRCRTWTPFGCKWGYPFYH